MCLKHENRTHPLHLLVPVLGCCGDDRLGGGTFAMIYFELLQEYKRHCSAGELEFLIEMDRATAPIFTPILTWQGDVITTIRSPYE